MKLKFIGLALALMLALVACGTADNTDDNQEGATDNTNNVEQTRFNNTGDGMTGDRDHMMKRNSERDQDRNDTNNNDNGNQDNDRYDVADEAATKIKDQIKEIDNAYVLTTDNNAYVAAGLDNDDNDRNNKNNKDGDDLTDEVKDEISKIVKSVDGDIDNVYVSTNPDFLDLTNNYVDDVDNGEPIEGFFDQFGNMVERLFPENNQ